ncbi:MAG: hypothetical protein JWO37_703 [Acidimicrobiales bacterium]|jgi:tetrahydromethanopterin S-methyltransferase subunit G|nr:hypothetical protein [Acidimicrobiales bacterium]
MTTVAAQDTPIRREDIEAKLRELRGEVEQTGQQAKQVGLYVGVAAAVVVVGLVFWLGKRKGKKETTVVEIRRV